MFPKPSHALAPNTYAFETVPLVKPTGFREYDARWLFGKEINLMGIQALGLGLIGFVVGKLVSTAWARLTMAGGAMTEANDLVFMAILCLRVQCVGQMRGMRAAAGLTRAAAGARAPRAK